MPQQGSAVGGKNFGKKTMVSWRENGAGLPIL
jgi:hypothetical protein